MLKTMRAIVQYQYDYFRTGDIMQLKPMILKNIAERVNLDISTISRITSNKYAETPFGIVLLKDLFTEGLVNQEEESISNRVIQSTIKEVIEAEYKKQPANGCLPRGPGTSLTLENCSNLLHASMRCEFPVSIRPRPSLPAPCRRSTPARSPV